MMNKLVIAALAVSTAIVATPAMAATGTVNVDGSVAPRCTVLSTNPETISLGELTQNNGTLATSLPNNTTGLTKSFTVVCTTATSTVSIAATPLFNTGQTAASGYTDTVHYTATAVADKAASGDTTVTYTTDVGTDPSNGPAVVGNLKNAANNVRVTLSGAHTTAATDLLFSGGYSATMTVTVSPS